MVSTRTGKTTNANADGEVEQQRGARAKRSSDKENSSASAQRASARPSTSTRRTKTAAAAEDANEAAAYEVEPTTPTSDKRTIKRGRATGGMPLSPLGEEGAGSPDVATNDQQRLHAAASAPLPDNSPSPLPKKPRTVDGEIDAAADTPSPRRTSRKAPRPAAAAAAAAGRPNISKHWLVWAVPVLLLALLGAALLSPDLRQHAHQRAEVVSGLLTEYAAQLQSLASTHTHTLQTLAAVRAQQLQQAAAPLVARARARAQQAADAANSALAAARSCMAALLAGASHDKEEADTAGAAPAGAPASTRGAVDAAQLAALLPAGAAWADVAGDMADKVNAQGPARNKGVGLLLGCSSSAACAAAAGALETSGFPCSMRVSGSSTDAASELQAQLAPFLARCPAGLVVLEQAQVLPLAAVPALNNALSELGGFQHGGHVDATQATYALLLELPQADDVEEAASADSAGSSETDEGGDAMAGVAAAERHVKAAFFGGLEAQAAAVAEGAEGDAAAAQQDTMQLLRAMRRRIEFAAPLRTSVAA